MIKITLLFSIISISVGIGIVIGSIIGIVVVVSLSLVFS